MSTLTTQQQIALAQETERAIELADVGLKTLCSLDASNDSYHLPLQLLAQGIERLLKLTFVLGTLESSGRIPASTEVREFGHDLLALTDEVVRIATADTGFISRPAIAEDLKFIGTDHDLRAMLTALSHFGKQGRYHDLEMLVGADPDDLGESPEQAWQRLESDFVRRHPEWIAQAGTAGFSAGYEALAADIIAVLQRFLRGVCRMWTLGPLGENGRWLTGTINRFLFLTDERLPVPRHPTRDR